MLSGVASFQPAIPTVNVQTNQFILRHPDGTEQGPLDVDQLRHLAESGLLPAGCQVRSALVRQWRKPEEYSFLKELMQPMSPEKTDGASPKAGAGAGEKAENGGAVLPQHAQRRRFTFTTASASLRLLAGLTDGLVLFGMWSILRVLWWVFVGELAGPFASPLGTALFIAIWYAASILWLTYTLAVFAQTAGQWFWGLMLVGVNGEQVMFDRAFLFVLLASWCGLVTPFLVFLLPSRRGLADLVSSTRVVRTRVVYAP